MSEHNPQPQPDTGVDPTRLPLFDDDTYVDPTPTTPAPAAAPAPSRAAAKRAAGWERVAATPEPPRRSRYNPNPAVPTSPPPEVPPPGHRKPDPSPTAPAADVVDWAEVTVLRRLAATQLSKETQERDGLAEETRREIGRKIVLELVADQAREADLEGRGGYSPRQQRALADAIFDSLFGLGRLQPLVDDDAVENIEIYGHDDVLLVHADGRIVRGPEVADSDEALINDLQFFGSRSDASERPFSPANPNLDLKLPGNHRLSANAWISPRPNAVIRRHRLVEITLDDLVKRDMLTPGMASFLDACVRAKKSIVISGPQGSGKTTMMRALAYSLPKYESIATIETEYELLLHEMPERHPRCMAFEARPGSGEKDANGRRVGEVTLDDLMYSVLRKNRSRIIVGEVRGMEVLPMLEAMQSGAGSLSTTHATSARGAIDRLVGLALKGGSHLKEFAAAQVAAHIDVIVQIRMEDDIEHQLAEAEGELVGQRRRYVSEIVLVEPGEDGHAAFSDVYVPGPTGLGVPKSIPADVYAELERFGFHDGGFTQGGDR